MRTHGAPIGCPWGPIGDPWGTHGDPWGTHWGPMRTHGDSWGPWEPMGAHGDPWERVGPIAHGGGGCTAANFCKSAYLRGGSRLEGRQPQPWARLEPRAPLKGSTHKEGFDGGCAPELPKFTSGTWGGAELINYGVNHRGVEGGRGCEGGEVSKVSTKRQIYREQDRQRWRDMATKRQIDRETE